MYKLLRPLIFLLPPEAAHKISFLFYKMFSGWFSAPDDPILKTRIAGLEFKTPVGLAAGYDKDAKIPGHLLKAGFGFIEVGTLTPKAQPGKPKPRIFRLKKDRALINRLGFNNKGFANARKNLVRLSENSKPGPIGINIGANKNSTDVKTDYLKGAEEFYGLGDYFTINVSSPNTPGLRKLQGEKALKRLIEGILAVFSKKTGKMPPLFIKIAPDLDKGQLEKIVKLALDLKITGLVISNTTVKRPKTLKSDKKNEDGGLSGQPLFDPSTKLLARAHKLSKGRLILIGVGGIETPEQAFEKIQNGATLVQLYTGLVYEGPALPARISKGLAELLRDHGYASVSQAVGQATKD